MNDDGTKHSKWYSGPEEAQDACAKLTTCTGVSKEYINRYEIWSYILRDGKDLLDGDKSGSATLKVPCPGIHSNFKIFIFFQLKPSVDQNH